MITDKLMQIIIENDGLHRIENPANEVVEKIVIEVKENVDATLLLTLQGTNMDMQIEGIVHPYATLHIVYKNEMKALKSVEHFTIKEGASVFVGYMELNGQTRKIDADYDLVDMEASVHMITTTLAKSSNDFHLKANHKHSHTYSNMENYGICERNGTYQVEASGIIDKGAKGSKSHQSTRVLTLSDQENVNVTPLLLIDENDVEASHACSIGEMNEDHLYYLQTRGLAKKQALALLTLSYVMPILKVVNDEQLAKELSEIVQSKVGL